MSLDGWLGRLGGSRFLADEARWVVLDVETSGLDPHHARLLAIAAIGVRADWPHRRLEIVVGDSFEVVLGQERVSSRENILLHGIGAQRQREGLAPPRALRAFADFVGRSPLLAFHAAFDEALIRRYSTGQLRRRLPNTWIDIEHLCAVTHPDVRARALDDWMAHFGIRCALRHQAAADTLAECELLLRIWPKVVAECADWSDVVRLAGRQRWIPRA